jgi:hypothetical protein
MIRRKVRIGSPAVRAQIAKLTDACQASKVNI